ncbi:MAG TPA: tetratricopeptide repeat protein, partial [Blastocatellia bacterium]|nr:tetratricopeptide repeat protein [Blastocatellia bacterium]
MRRYPSVILVFILVMTLPGCTHRRSVSVAPRANPQKDTSLTGSPSELSNFIQATLRISQENTVAAEEALKKLHKRRPYLAELASRIAANGNDVDSRRQLAEAYMEEGLLPYAFQMYQEIQSIKPNDSLSEVGVARVWDQWGDFGIAHQHAERAVILEPKSAEALEALGRINLHQNQLDQALSAFLSAIAIKPQNASLLSNAGYVFLKRGDLLQARLYLENAVAVDDSLVEARNNLGIVLARMGERDRALHEFMAVNDPAAAFNNLGVVYMEQKRWSEARDAFRRALALQPGHAKARANLVEAEAHVPIPTIINLPGRPEVGAVEKKTKNQTPVDARSQVTVTGRDSRVRVAYSDALERFRSRRFAEAIDIFQWLLLQDPSDTIASNCEYWIGESYFGLADYKEAYAAFKRVTSYTGSAKRNDAVVMMRRAAVKQRQ